MSDTQSVRVDLGYASTGRSDDGVSVHVPAPLDAPQLRSLASLLLEQADAVSREDLSQGDRGLAMAEVVTEATTGLRPPERLRLLHGSILLLTTEEAAIASELAASTLDGQETDTLGPYEHPLSEVAGLLEMEQDEAAAYLRDRAEAHDRLRGLLPPD